MDDSVVKDREGYEKYIFKWYLERKKLVLNTMKLKIMIMKIMVKKEGRVKDLCAEVGGGGTRNSEGVEISRYVAKK